MSKKQSDSSKEMVYKIVRDYTIAFCFDFSVENNAVVIAEKANISRSVASRYLNEGYENKKLIKVESRPVSFYDVTTIEEKFKFLFDRYDFLNQRELISYIKTTDHRFHGFEEMISYNPYMSNLIMEIRSFISYPNRSCMSITFLGEKGTGKKFLLSLLFDYAKNKREVEVDKELVVFDASSYKEGQIEKLIGTKDGNSSVFEQAEGSLLVFDKINYLSKDTQDFLASFIEKGYYYDWNNNKINRNLKIILICENENEISQLLKECQYSILRFPNLKNRSINEKAKLVIFILKEEEENIGRRITINSTVFDVLVRSNPEQNLDGLTNLIKVTCAMAYSMQKNEGDLKISLCHLPEKYLHNLNVEEDELDDQFYSLEELTIKAGINKSKEIYEQVLTELSSKKKEKKSIISALVKKYEEEQINRPDTNDVSESFSAVIDRILLEASKKYNCVINTKISKTIGYNLYYVIYIDPTIRDMEDSNHELLQKLDAFFPSEKKIKIISDEIDQKVEAFIGAKMLAIDKQLLKKAIEDKSQTDNEFSDLLSVIK